MGYTLFTASGTFSPSTYGLNAGDLIHIKCVGGGGGGGGSISSGATNGGTSSFGSILTAVGGNAGIGGANVLPTQQDGSCRGGMASVSMSLPYGTSWYTLCLGGTGGHGWVPGMHIPLIAGNVGSIIGISIVGSGTSGLYMYPTGLASGGSAILEVGGMLAPMVFSSGSRSSVNGDPTASTAPYGHYGAAYCNSSYAMGGPGGLGYGAGGGGNADYRNGYYGSGGNGGCITDKDYLLPNLNNIAVTVGAGGVGIDNGGYSSGGGARGCVAIWW